MNQKILQQSWDVVVAGGGPGGVSAAAAAAKRGAKVLLVERYGYLGGMATAGLINPFMSYTVKATGQNIASGIFNEILDRLAARGGLAQDRVTFDDEQMKFVLDDMLEAYGVTSLLHSTVMGAEVQAGVVQALRITGKSGELRLVGKVFIDSTGDGDLAALAGCEVALGRDEDGFCQPMTLCFRVAGVDTGGETYHWDHPLRLEIDRIYQEAKQSGTVTNPREDVLIFATLHPDVLHFNTTRVIQKSGVDVFDLTEAERIGRKQVVEMVELLRRNVPAFKNAYLQKMAAHIGVRESRRVMGGYLLTAEEVLAGAKFPDGIARSVYPVDIHNPAGTGTVLKHLAEDAYYEIPFRCLVPRGMRNLLIGSRCISATHAAHSSLRVMPVVSGIGEAAGTAAAICAQRGIFVDELDGREVKSLIL